jgi:hypothetical protein
MAMMRPFLFPPEVEGRARPGKRRHPRNA